MSQNMIEGMLTRVALGLLVVYHNYESLESMESISYD